VPGGETTSQVVARVGECVRDAWGALGPGECGVLVSHGGALKVSLLAILGWPAELAATLEALHNCCWAELRDSGVEGRVRLSAYNRRAVQGADFASPNGVG
jgi:probable phosphoglycerate mutase